MKYLSYLILFVFVACGSSKESQTLFLKEIPLESTVLTNNNRIHKPPVSINVVDTFLVLFRMQQPHYQVYSTVSHAFLGEFGMRGRGMDEFESPGMLNYPPGERSTEPSFLIYDLGKQRLTTVNLLDFVSGREFMAHERLPNTGKLVMRMHNGHGNYYAVERENYSQSPKDGESFAIIDIEQQRVLSIPYQAPEETSIHPLLTQAVLRASIAYNENLGLFAAVPIYLPLIRFYDVKGDLKFTSVFDSLEENSLALSLGQTEIHGEKQSSLQLYKGRKVSKIYYDEDYIILCTDPEAQWISKEKVNTKLLYRVFDWTGKQKYIFSLHTNPDTSFTYDKKNHRLYFYDNLKEDNNLFYADLPKF